MSYNTSLSVFIFKVKLSQIWAVGFLSTWLLCHSGIFPSLLEHFLTFWHKILQAYFVLSLAQPWSQPLLQGALFPFSATFETKIWVLSVLTAFQVSLILRPSQRTDLGNICIPPIPHYKVHSGFFSFPICNFFLW